MRKKRERPNKKEKAQKKRERKAKLKKEKAQKREREKERRGNVTILFSTLVLQSSIMIFIIESLLFCHFHILVEIFVIELGLYIPTMGFLKCPRSS